MNPGGAHVSSVLGQAEGEKCRSREEGPMIFFREPTHALEIAAFVLNVRDGVPGEGVPRPEDKQ